MGFPFKSTMSWFELCADYHHVKISACFRVRANVLCNIRNASLSDQVSLSVWKSEVAFHDRDLKGLVLCPKSPYFSNNSLLSFSHLLLSLICSLALFIPSGFFAQPTSIILFSRSPPTFLTFGNLATVTHHALNNISSAFFLFWKLDILPGSQGDVFP